MHWQKRRLRSESARRTPRFTLVVAAALAGLACIGRPALAQDDDAIVSTAAPVSAESIQQRLDQLESSSDLPAETISAAAALLREALVELDRAVEHGAREAEFTRQAAGAGDRLAEIGAELAQPMEAFEPDLSDPPPIDECEAALATANAELEAARTLVAELETETARRNSRHTAIRDELSRIGAEVSALREQMSDSAADHDEVASASSTRARAKLSALTAELASLEAERASYNARSDLLAARRDRAQRRLQIAEGDLGVWRQVTEASRQQAAEAQALEAGIQSLQAMATHPVLSGYARETARIAAQRALPDGLPARISRAEQLGAEARAQRASIEQRYRGLRQRIDVAGLTSASGVRLRVEYETLPKLAGISRDLRNIRDDLENAEYLLIDRQEQRATAGLIDEVVKDLVAQADLAGPVEDAATLAEKARDLASSRRDLLDQLVSDSTSYFAELVELEASTLELLEVAEAYRTYIGQRVLWVRSIRANHWLRWEEAVTTSRWLVSPDQWSDAVENAVSDLDDNWPMRGPIISVILTILVTGRWRRKWLRNTGLRGPFAQRPSVAQSMVALLLTLVSAALPALMVYWIGWELSLTAAVGVESPHALGEGMMRTALHLYPLALLVGLLTPGGLAEAHFFWPSSAIAPARRNLRWLIPVTVPLVAIITALYRFGSEADNASLGRLALSVFLLAHLLFFQRVFHPSGPLVDSIIQKNPHGTLDRLRAVWYSVLLMSPIALTVITWLGFHHTGLVITSAMVDTFHLVLLIALINAVLIRWLRVAGTRLAIREARESQEEGALDDSVPVGAAPGVLAEGVDLVALGAKARLIIRSATTLAIFAGLLVIWSGLLPAFHMLERVQVWPSVELVEPRADEAEIALEMALAEDIADRSDATTEAPSAAAPLGRSGRLPGASETVSESGSRAVETPPSIRLDDVVIALLTLVITWVLFRNIPGLVELLLLELWVEASARFAIVTILRYLIAIIGLIVAFETIGLTWSSIQFLAAALTFGLAFGLQEIFANFASGIILLIERPIRIGDTVTVGTVTGTVQRIQMRAATIIDWDRKEHLIPNRTFVTGEIINWTLSDPVLRASIPISVNYDADIPTVERLLLESSSAHERVLEDPKPYVFFVRVGESALELELRLFIPHIDHSISVKNAVQRAIVERFRAAGIDIAIPRRNVVLTPAHEDTEVTLSSNGPGRGSK